MFQKYSTPCRCPERPVAPSVPYCPPSRPSIYDISGNVVELRNAMPESIRLRQQVETCTPYIRPGLPSSRCVPGGEEGGNPGTSNVGSPGTYAPVEVRTRTAGEYTTLLGTQALNAASNAFNPDARFQQYFPEFVPAPLSVVCPERIPNPVTVRDRGCVPQGLFAPSVPPS
jgi:hypothetical protein